MAVSQQKVREARAFLRQRNLMPPIIPRVFARSADEMNKSFTELLRFIMRLRQGQQNQPAQNAEIIRSAAGVQE